MDSYPSRPDRRPVKLSGYGLLADGATFNAEIVDLSYEGCKIRSGRPLEPGTKIKLSVLRLGLIDAEVRWFDDGIAGLVFPAVEAPKRELWPRRSNRVTVTADIALRKPGQPNYSARIFDVSPEGCKVEYVDKPALGSKIWIKFDGLENLEAEVCWIENYVMGVNFARSMHPAVFDLLVQRLGGGN